MDHVSLTLGDSGRGIVIHNLPLDIFQLQPTFFIFGLSLVLFVLFFSLP